MSLARARPAGPLATGRSSRRDIIAPKTHGRIDSPSVSHPHSLLTPVLTRVPYAFSLQRRNRGVTIFFMLLFFALAILTAIQFLHLFVIAAVCAVIIAASMGVSRLVFRLTGSPTA